MQTFCKCKNCCMSTNDEVIGTAEAAQTLGIDRSTLTRWVKRDIIPTFRRGAGKTNEILFRRSDIEALASAPSGR